MTARFAFLGDCKPAGASSKRDVDLWRRHATRQHTVHTCDLFHFPSSMYLLRWHTLVLSPLLRSPVFHDSLSMATTSLLLLSLVRFISSASAGEAATGTCLKRSAMLYTSGSATYAVSQYPSTPEPTPSCPVTMALPPVTTTIYASSPMASGSASPNLIVDGGFERGSQIPFQISKSSLEISGQVAQGGPILPESGSNYL